MLDKTIQLLCFELPLRLAGRYVDRRAASAEDINAQANRHFRARVLQRLSSALRDASESINFSQEINITRDRVTVTADGIKLDATATKRYFKVPGNRQWGNEGKELFAFLRDNGIRPKVMVDGGACFGEISLYFASRLPDLRIYAFEPVLANFQILRDAISLQSFDSDNLRVFRLALAGHDGHVNIQSKPGSQNSILRPGDERVRCLTLESACKELEIGAIDFLKLDLEGAEPLLADSISLLRPRAMLIEISQGNTKAAYVDLARSLVKLGIYEFFDRTTTTRIEADSLAVFTDHRLRSGEAFDLWCIRSD